MHQVADHRLRQAGSDDVGCRRARRGADERHGRGVHQRRHHPHGIQRRLHVYRTQPASANVNTGVIEATAGTDMAWGFSLGGFSINNAGNHPCTDGGMLVNRQAVTINGGTFAIGLAPTPTTKLE